MIADREHARALAVDARWRELGELAASRSASGDQAFAIASAAVSLIENRPGRAIASLEAISNPLAAHAQIFHWVFAHAAARRAHVRAVSTSLIRHLNWVPRLGPSRELELSEHFRVAETAFRAVLALKAVDSVWNDLGVLYFSFGRFDIAAEMFEECLALDPGHRHGAINYAVSLLVQDKYDMAHEFVERTAFSAALPSCLSLNKAFVELSRGMSVSIPLRSSKDWNRWCAYSFGWRGQLMALFEC